MIGARACRCRSALLQLVVLQLATYSLPSHKEFRFLLPALQLAMPYCGAAALRLWSNTSPLCIVRRAGRLVVAGILAVQLLMAGYFGAFHQR